MVKVCPACSARYSQMAYSERVKSSAFPSTAALRAVRSKATPLRTIRCAGVRLCRRRCAATRARSSATRKGLDKKSSAPMPSPSSTAASFPLFYSTSFGGAYWLWIIILFSFVIQAVSYEFQNKIGNFLGPKTFQICLIINGIVGPLLLGGAVATFFNGSNFLIDKGNITNSLQPVISRWANASHGLDALLDPWNVVLGLAVLMLARILGMLYIKNNIEHPQIQERCTRQLPWNTLLFLLFFLPFLIRLLVKDGFSTSSSGITIESMKYLHNLLEMPILIVILLIGVVLVLFGIFKSSRSVQYRKGIWFTCIGTVLTVLVLLLIAGWNNTAYYPSNIDLQSSLTLANSCSSEFTLRTMAIVSLLIPFVLAYIVFAWRAIDRKRITQEEIEQREAY